MNAVLAVALGLAPVDSTASGATQVNPGDYTGLIGSYSQSTDRGGTAHLRGVDRRTGRPFDIAVSANGHVEGSVGEMYVTFEYSRAA